MPITWRDLRLRVRALLRSHRVERELDDELRFHLEMEARKQAAAGLKAHEAQARARARFGSAAVAAEACRDARGTRFIDACRQDLVSAFRSVRRAPLVALTIVGTVALGLGLVAAAFTIFNVFVFRADAVRDPGALFAVERLSSGGGNRPRFTRPEYERLRHESGVFSDAFASLPDVSTRIDGRLMEGHLVTGNFFDVLGVDAALGRTLTPADDSRPAGRPVIVLSHNGWTRLFNNDPAIIGRRLLVNGFSYEIAGVAPEGFRGLSALPPDYWAPLSLVGQFRRWAAGREDTVGIEIVGRLKPGLSERTALAGLAVWMTGAASGTAVDPRAAGIRLQSRRTAVPLSPGVLLAFSPLFVAFGSILLIGCANVANLLLARAVSRQREIGIRLSLGASRGRVVRQLLTESLLLALASAACGLALSRLLLDGVIAALTRTMPAELAEFLRLAAPRADWRVVGFLLIAAIVATVLFGLVPALQATRLDLVRIVRGESTRNARPGRARNVLIVAQVTASALLLICAGVFLRSALRASAAEPGFRLTDTIVVDLVNEQFRAPMLAAITADRSVAAVAAAWPEPPIGRPRAAFASTTAADTGRSPQTYRFVSPTYFSVLDIPVVRGRAFTDAEARSNAAVAMVSAATARRLWPRSDAVDQVLRLEPDASADTSRADEPQLPSQTLVVVGVVRDVAGFRFAGPEADIFVPTTLTTRQTDLVVRVHGDPEPARRALLERLTIIDPNMGMVMTLRTLGRLDTYPLQVAFWLTIVLGGLALALTLSGIFSVLSYLVEQRTREIGVRMALGATTMDVTRLVLWQSLRLVGVGLVAGGGLAWGLATAFVSTPIATRIGGILHVFDPLAYVVSLLCIVTACALAASLPAFRAARLDPMTTLRQE